MEWRADQVPEAGGLSGCASGGVAVASFVEQARMASGGACVHATFHLDHAVRSLCTWKVHDGNAPRSHVGRPCMNQEQDDRCTSRVSL